MELKPTLNLDSETASGLAGITGVGWTASTLGFLGTALGYGNDLVDLLVVEPRSLLYVAVICFLATLGLDRLAQRSSEE